MNRILYNASFVGSSRGFFNIVTVIIVLIFGLIRSNHELKRKCNINSARECFVDAFERFFAIIWRIFSFIVILSIIVSYCQTIIGYKRGKYREVEGIVEDYSPSGVKVKNFKVNEVEFEISGYNVTWGYSYWSGKNVITGDGQHLKIRYVPLSDDTNCIVYIEEIAEE